MQQNIVRDDSASGGNDDGERETAGALRTEAFALRDLVGWFFGVDMLAAVRAGDKERFYPRAFYFWACREWLGLDNRLIALYAGARAHRVGPEIQLLRRRARAGQAPLSHWIRLIEPAFWSKLEALQIEPAAPSADAAA